MGGETRLPRERVLPVATRLYRALEPVCDRILIAGSLRRQKPDVGDIEIVAVPKLQLFADMFGDLQQEPTPSMLEATIKALLDGPLAWDTKVKRNGPSYKRFTVPELDGMPFELFLCDEAEYGYQCMIRTGSAEFTKAMMTERRFEGGLKPSHLDCRGGVKTMQGGRMTQVDLYSEKDVFKAWGLPVLPPSERDEAGIAKLRGMKNAAR